jgi:dinuclear metal center YbgI/SA1388 family protein
VKISEILNVMEMFTPVRWAFDFDNVGLLLGSGSSEVHRAVISLDLSSAAVDYAKSIDAELIVTHHPSLFQPVKSLTDSNPMGRNLIKMARHGIGHIAAHTNWDAAPKGINDTLARILGLENVRPFGSGAKVNYSKIVVFASAENSDVLIDVMANEGAGRIGFYRRCAYKSSGIGTFEPLPGSNPSIGRIGKSDEVREDRIEMICPTRIVDRVIEAMRRVHTYEQPAFDVLEIEPLVEQPNGRIGELAEPTMLFQMNEFLFERLGAVPLLWGDPDTTIRRVAVVGGAADDEFRNALKAGADLFITGEVKHHNALEAVELGLTIASAGHFATENPGMKSLQEELSNHCPEVEWHFFEPRIGFHARPIEA